MPSIKRKQQKKYWSNQIKFTNEAHKMYSVYTASPYHDTMIVIVSFLNRWWKSFPQFREDFSPSRGIFPFPVYFYEYLML